jgi:asparagine synthase (glutamine-hydrolysing)
LNADYLTRETALREVTTIECGERVERIGAEFSSCYLWKPADLASLPAQDDFHECARTLRAVTQSCVDAWASEHSSILHTLSGGLDSSIVLACLCDAPDRPRVTCTNDYFDGGSGDEREYARSMSQRHSVELVERHRDSRIDARIFLSCRRTVRPVLAFTACDAYPAGVQLARSRGATAIFTGELGDNIFGGAPGIEIVQDYRERYGLGPGLWRTAMDYSKLSRLSVWKVLRGVLFADRAADKRRSWSALQYASGYEPDFLRGRMVTSDAIHDYAHWAESHVHPWFQDVDGVPTTKLLLMYSLLVITSAAYEPPFARAGDPLMVSPLASQPLVESSLRVSSHLHMLGGVDRAAARFAFADKLSDIVLNRRGKGNAGHWVRELVRNNRDFLRETLLDGCLVKERILDRQKIEDALSGKVNNSMLVTYELIIHLYIESWVRQWYSTERSPSPKIHREQAESSDYQPLES